MPMGRVSLPKELADYAGLNGQVTFVGLGRRFEIWSPAKYEIQSADSRKLARENRHRFAALLGGLIRAATRRGREPYPCADE